MIIYYLLHQLYRPLRDQGIKQMINNVKYNDLDENVTIDLKPYLKDLEYKEVNNFIITSKGIFLIFPVSLKGMIYGNNPGSKWIQRFNHQQIYIPNPIKVNEDKIKETMEKHLINYPINNIVLFINNNNQFVKSDKAVKLNDLYDYLINFNSNINLNEQEIKELYETIKLWNN